MEALSVRLEGLSKRFVHRVKGEVYAARDVTLDVAPGEFLTLLGPSGCGKTTTLRMVAGFEKPDAGRIRFGATDVTETPANLRNIGFVFQNYALFPHLSTFENVAYGLRVRGIDGGSIGRAVTDVLALVGLAGYEPQFPAQLSGGEQQRVALARAIVIRPRVLLFDEPLSNLDAKLRVQMRQEIRELQKRLAITTLYVTHDQEEAMAVSDRIVVMNKGSVVQQGSAEDLYRRPASRFVAQFVGRLNVIPATVLAVEGSYARIALLGSERRILVGGSAAAAGGKVDLGVRPEAVAVASVASPGSIEATVASRTFLGEKIEYALRVGDQALNAVRQPGPEDGDADARVFVTLADDDLILLPGSDA